VARVAGIELLAAAQAIDHRRPLTTSPALEEVWSRIRAVVPRYDEDRHFGPDLEAAHELVASGAFSDLTTELFDTSTGNGP